MSLDLRKVEKIGLKYKQIVFGYINRAQTLFLSENPYFNIVDLIKHICLLYYYNVFESSILTEKEREDFLELLNKSNKYLDNYEWKLIYSATGDSIKRSICVKEIYGKQNVLCLFHGINGNICGGYSSTGWVMNKHNETETSWSYPNLYSEDSDAFIFSIKSNSITNTYKPMLFDIQNSATNYALRYSRQQYCVFGRYFTLFLERDYIYCNNNSDFKLYPKNNYLLGGKHGEKIKMIEIFQLQ
eukprot:98378_1